MMEKTSETAKIPPKMYMRSGRIFSFAFSAITAAAAKSMGHRMKICP